MSFAAYYDYITRLIKIMLEVPDSDSYESQTSQDTAVAAVFRMRDNIINAIVKKNRF
jgi:hypothetical protein